jgi:2-polyprenyl-3-methyl-5-hydroxy-6-metoxy-1,4-benzoquinol methylase
MTEAERAQEWWDYSADGWLELMGKEDRNRVHLLDPVMLELAGDVVGKDVLDVGCGEGRFCRMLSRRGASTVGVDPTQKLLDAARSKHPEGVYHLARGESLPFEVASFDLVISYIVLIDITDFRSAIREMARVLRPGGCLLIANLNPFATTRERAWYQDENGKKLHLAVEEYFTERSLHAKWGKVSIDQWHRPLEAYMTALIGAGLVLRAYREPRPTMEAVQKEPELWDEYQVPLFHVMLWERPLGEDRNGSR